MLLNYGVGEDSWESLELKGDPTSQSSRKSVLNIHWKDWCWSWSSNTLATWCKELTHLKRPWCWERLKAGGEWDGRGWDSWMALPTGWTWVWIAPGIGDGQGNLACYSPWGHKELDTTERLNWTELIVEDLWNINLLSPDMSRLGFSCPDLEQSRGGKNSWFRLTFTQIFIFLVLDIAAGQPDVRCILIPL